MGSVPFPFAPNYTFTLSKAKKETKSLDISQKSSTFAPAYQKVGAFSSVGSEHLPYKQRVGGSNPSTPTKGSAKYEKTEG